MNKRQEGCDQEALAAEWLKEQGFVIVEKNYRCSQGEIDLVARDGRYLVFIEVKYRKGPKKGHPAEAVDVRKQRRISRAAAVYCCQRKIPETQACRFDVVSILDRKIEHLKDAFAYI